MNCVPAARTLLNPARIIPGFEITIEPHFRAYSRVTGFYLANSLYPNFASCPGIRGSIEADLPLFVGDL